MKTPSLCRCRSESLNKFTASYATNICATLLLNAQHSIRLFYVIIDILLQSILLQTAMA